MQINFTGIKIQGSALMQLAKLNAGTMEGSTQKAYDALKTAASSLSDDILIETSGKNGVKISKLSPLSKDVVEITNNADFTLGLQEAIEIIAKDSVPCANMQIAPLTIDPYRQIILAKIKDMT